MWRALIAGPALRLKAAQTKTERHGQAAGLLRTLQHGSLRTDDPQRSRLLAACSHGRCAKGKVPLSVKARGRKVLSAIHCNQMASSRADS